MTSLAVLARYANSEVDSLKDLNPELMRASTPPGHYALRVPPGMSGVTARALASIPASQRLDFKTYKVRRGETLARVAAKFHLSPEDLLEANDLKKAQFKAGRVLKVPPPPPSPIDARDLLPPVERAATLEDHPLEALPSIPLAPPEAVKPVREVEAAPTRERPAAVVVADADAVAPPAGSAKARQAASAMARPALEAHPRSHLVKRGETLFAVAVRYGLDVKQLRKWNRIKGNKIHSGQRLRLGP